MSGVSLERSFVIVSPAVENNLSVGAEVAGTARIFLANFACSGKRVALFFHQYRGSTLTSFTMDFSFGLQWSSVLAQIDTAEFQGLILLFTYSAL